MEPPLRVTLTLEGSVEQIRVVLNAIPVDVLAGANTQVTPRLEVDGSVWSSDEFRSLWAVLSRKARLVLSQIASRSEGYPVEDLVADLRDQLQGDRGHAIAGALSSVGHRMKRYPGKQALYTRDYTRGLFTMPTHVAELIRQEEAK